MYSLSNCNINALIFLCEELIWHIFQTILTFSFHSFKSLLILIVSFTTTTKTTMAITQCLFLLIVAFVRMIRKAVDWSGCVVRIANLERLVTTWTHRHTNMIQERWERECVFVYERERKRENINLAQHDLLTGWKHSICLILFIEGKLFEFSTVVPQTDRKKNIRRCSCPHLWWNCMNLKKTKKKTQLKFDTLYIITMYCTVCECLDSGTFYIVLVKWIWNETTTWG